MFISCLLIQEKKGEKNIEEFVAHVTCKYIHINISNMKNIF